VTSPVETSASGVTKSTDKRKIKKEDGSTSLAPKKKQAVTKVPGKRATTTNRRSSGRRASRIQISESEEDEEDELQVSEKESDHQEEDTENEEDELEETEESEPEPEVKTIQSRRSSRSNLKKR
jgi:hypothetical protein